MVAYLHEIEDYSIKSHRVLSSNQLNRFNESIIKINQDEILNDILGWKKQKTASKTGFN